MASVIRNTRLEVRPLTGTLGAEVFGADLSQPVNDELFGEIHQALLDHGIIVFREQEVTPELHKALGRRFGPLKVHPYLKGAGDGSDPEMLEFRKEPADRYVEGNGWHIDHTWKEKPQKVALLYCVECPDSGGDTLFANMYLAYETLSPALRAMLDSMRIVQQANPDLYSGANLKLTPEQIRSMRAVHPAVRTHPETKRKSLFVHPATSLHFEGWSEEESRPLIRFLWDHAKRPEFTCRVRWRKGSLAIWDNRCTMHNALDDYYGKRRVMKRVAVDEEERPY
jgi:taurine dioxygenase